MVVFFQHICQKKRRKRLSVFLIFVYKSFLRAGKRHGHNFFGLYQRCEMLGEVGYSVYCLEKFIYSCSRGKGFIGRLAPLFSHLDIRSFGDVLLIRLFFSEDFLLYGRLASMSTMLFLNMQFDTVGAKRVPNSVLIKPALDFFSSSRFEKSSLEIGFGPAPTPYGVISFTLPHRGFFFLPSSLFFNGAFTSGTRSVYRAWKRLRRLRRGYRFELFALKRIRLIERLGRTYGRHRVAMRNKRTPAYMFEMGLRSELQFMLSFAAWNRANPPGQEVGRWRVRYKPLEARARLSMLRLQRLLRRHIVAGYTIIFNRYTLRSELAPAASYKPLKVDKHTGHPYIYHPYLESIYNLRLLPWSHKRAVVWVWWASVEACCWPQRRQLGALVMSLLRRVIHACFYRSLLSISL